MKRSKVPGIELNIPSPIQAVASEAAATHHAILRALDQGAFLKAVRTRVKNQAMKSSQNIKPITPCSQRMSANPFSIPMGFLTCPSRK
jgi:hypothetical protein